MPPFSRMIYVACPYSDKDPEVTQERVATFCKVMSHLTMMGSKTTPRLHFVSPVLNHLLVQADQTLPTDFNFWNEYSYDLLRRCDELWVLTLPQWDWSTGVINEIEEARRTRGGMIIRFICPHTFNIVPDVHRYLEKCQ